MADRAQITAATAEIKIDGKMYQMSPLSDKDIAELDNWIRVRVVRLARASLTGEETKQEREEVLGVAFKYASSLTWLDKGAEEMTTLEGVARVLKQTLKKHHPEITAEYLGACIVDGKIDMDDATDIFDLLNALPEEAAKKKLIRGAGSRKKTKRRRGKLTGSRSTNS
jgi:hypothetical protein